MLHGPYARVSILRRHDGDTVDFEAGYIRHLESHRQAKDTLGLVWLDHDALWPLAGAPVMEGSSWLP